MKVITDIEWEIFVDKGFVDNEVLEIIALRIKLGNKLTDREKSIYDHYGEYIEQLLDNHLLSEYL